MHETIALTLLLFGAGAPAEVPTFRVGIEMPTQIPVTPAVEHAISLMGIDFINYYVRNFPEADLPEAETSAAMLDFCERLGLDFALACHHRNPSDATVTESLSRGGKRFEGILIDELAHIRLTNPQFAATAKELMLADPETFTSLADGYEKTLAGFRRLKAHFDALGAPRVTATHVWPDFLHMAARAGLTPCPKIQKEFYSPVSLAVGMGAALQYGRDLWVDADLWYFVLIPGHPAEEVRSNLMLAYWLGADLVYLEGAGYNLITAGKQGIPFSLMTQITPDRHQLTPHGEMLKSFCREYLPAHPRPYSFRDVRPEVAIIRFEDGDSGQAAWGAPRLYGNNTFESDEDTRAWFAIWNELTWGTTGADGIAWFKGSVPHPRNEPRFHQDLTPSLATDPEAAEAHSFFVPLNGTVVFDHLVGYDRLEGIPLLFLTGKHVSNETMAAIRKRVQEGATCVAWGPLAKANGFPGYEGGVEVRTEGEGTFVLTDDFGAEAAKEHYAAHLGSPDEIRYRFGEHTVVLKRVTDNTVAVQLTSAE